MEHTKINGNPGFGIPSDIGETGDAGNNVFFAKLSYITIDENNKDSISSSISSLDSSVITFERYYGRIEPSTTIPVLHIDYKEKSMPFKQGDIVIANIDRCCFFNVNVFGDETKQAFIDNEPLYKISLSPVKDINFSFTAAKSSSEDEDKVIIYPSVSVSNKTLIRDFHVEIIRKSDLKFIDYRCSMDDFSENYVEFALPDWMNTGTVEINIYAMCNTNTQGMKEYFLGTQNVTVG